MIGVLIIILYYFFGTWNTYVNICNTSQAYRAIIRQLLPLNRGRSLVLYNFTCDVISRYPLLKSELTEIYNEMSLL